MCTTNAGGDGKSRLIWPGPSMLNRHHALAVVVTGGVTGMRAERSRVEFGVRLTLEVDATTLPPMEASRHARPKVALRDETYGTCTDTLIRLPAGVRSGSALASR